MNIAAVDLFCGIGGLTHGLSLSGIPVIAGFDIDESCRFSYESNNNAKFICKDITKVTRFDLEKYYNKNDIRILVGCAPCQPFSRYSGRYRKNGYSDEKWALLNSFGVLIKESKPDIISMENVPGLINEQIFEDFKNTLTYMKYSVNTYIVNCASYGVPQHRKRLVLLASKFGNIPLIKPIYNKGNYPTVRESLGNLPHIKDGETHGTDPLHSSSKLSKINKERIRQSKQGGTWRDWEDKLRLTCHLKDSGRSFPSVYGRMEWDKPAPTITTQFFGYGNGRFGHPEQDRAISLREGAILQSIPPGYNFYNEKSSIFLREIAAHIGNAVPVALGKVIGISIQKHLKEVKIN